MSNYHFTLTGGTAAATVDGFVAVITTANFLDADLGCLDGTKFTGGNLIVYADATKAVRYPIHVVNFTTGGSPDVLVWVRVPTYASADSIYIEADSVQTTQPVVGGTYGQYSTWSGRTLRMQCISDNAQEVASGLSVHDGGGSYISTPFGNGLYLNNTSVSTTPPYTSPSQMTYTFAAKIDSMGGSGNVFIQGNNFRLQKPWVTSNTGNFYFNGNSADYGNCFSSWIKMGEWHSYTMTYNFSTDKVMRFYRDGVLVGTDTHWDKPKLNGLFNLLGGNNVVSSVAFTEFKTSIVPAAQIALEYANQSDPASFWTASGYGGGGTTPPTNVYTIILDSGQHTLTGAEISTISMYTALELEEDSYVTSGTDQRVAAQSKLDLATSNYETAGTELTVKAESRISTDPAIYSVDGTNIVLTYTTVTPINNYIMDIAAGGYNLTGTAVGNKVDYKTLAAVGSYSTAGTNVPLKYMGTMHLDSSSYSYTGSNIIMYSDFTTTLEATSFNVVGTDNLVRYATKMGIDPGTYLNSFTSILLRYSGDIIQDFSYPLKVSYEVENKVAYEPGYDVEYG